EVFFRPPRGFTKLDPQQAPNALLNSYLPGRSNAPFKDVQLAVFKGKKSEEDFRKEVMLAFGGLKPLERKTVEHKASHRQQTCLSCRSDDQPSQTTAYVYFTKQGDSQAAVVFRVPTEGGLRGDAVKMIEFSLASLALGQAAREQLAGFKGSAPAAS